jgi:hypothetical protein
MGREEATNTEHGLPGERTVIDAGVLSGRSWWLYSDGTVEGETVVGMQRFTDFKHFKSFIESSPAVRAVSVSKRYSEDVSPHWIETDHLPKSPQSPSQISTAPPINAPPSDSREAVVVKRLMPKLIERVINGLAVLVIFCSGWIMLSEVIRLDEAKQLKEATRLEEAKKLKEATKLEDIDYNMSATERFESVKLSDWTWRAEGYIPIIFASFTVQNMNEFDVKDVEITCELFEYTGAFVDRLVTPIYDIIKAKSSKAFDNLRMEAIHSQAIFSVPRPITSNDCRISNFARDAP